jgi:hypothetical protein
MLQAAINPASVDAVSAKADAPCRTMRICFLFNAQLHQVLHGLGAAIALARRPGHEVDIRVSSAAHLAFIAPLLPSSGPRPRLAPIGSAVLRRIARLRGSDVPPKRLTLFAARRELMAYDAIVVPERTSLALRSFGVTRPRLVHIDHGAGDRAVGFDPRIAEFDYVLVAGEKQRRRMLREGLIRPGAYAVVGYPKFELADRVRQSGWTPFSDARPIVLYNPHFDPALGSWDAAGLAVIERIVACGRYNLVIAPHIRLFDTVRRRRAAERLLAPWAGRADVHVDLDSPRLVDMTYTQIADIYLGDVSSQVYEFLRRPRPCVFLDAHGVAWRGNENYAHWRYGDVVRDPAALVAALDAAASDHVRYRGVQEAGFRDTFTLAADASAERAADAIARIWTRPGNRDPERAAQPPAPPRDPRLPEGRTTAFPPRRARRPGHHLG